MVRKILGVVAGYLAMALVISILLTTAYFALGADGTFQAGTYKVTGVWLGVWIGGHVVAAFVGGFICRLIGRSSKVVTAFAGIVLVVSLIGGILQMRKPSSGARGPETTMTEASDNAEQPGWLYILTPLLSAAAIYAAGGRKKDE